MVLVVMAYGWALQVSRSVTSDSAPTSPADQSIARRSRRRRAVRHRRLPSSWDGCSPGCDASIGLSAAVQLTPARSARTRPRLKNLRVHFIGATPGLEVSDVRRYRDR